MSDSDTKDNIQSAAYMRSFTCADLESPTLLSKQQGSPNRRIRSAKQGVNLLSSGANVVQAVPSNEERDSGGKINERTPD